MKVNNKTHSLDVIILHSGTIQFLNLVLDTAALKIQNSVIVYPLIGYVSNRRYFFLFSS